MRELVDEVGGVISVDATLSSYTFIHVFAYSRMVDFGKVEERGKADMARPVTKEMELASRQYWLRHDQVIAIANALRFQASAMELLSVKTRDGHLPAEMRRFADILLKEWDDAPT